MTSTNSPVNNGLPSAPDLAALDQVFPVDSYDLVTSSKLYTVALDLLEQQAVADRKYSCSELRESVMPSDAASVHLLPLETVEESNLWVAAEAALVEALLKPDEES